MEDDRSSPSPPARTRPAAMPEFNSIPAEKWDAAEAEICKVLNRVSPTSDSEDKRNEVTDYMRRLIKNVAGVETVQGNLSRIRVLQYGSVPLKTYLPQGDIDLTVVSIHDWECNLPREVYDIFLAKQLLGNGEFEFKEIRFIDAEVVKTCCVRDRLDGEGLWLWRHDPDSEVEEAEWQSLWVALGSVKLVKCIVNDIVIDVSFNQLGGLCALCFLEQVDRLIEKDHLFKRSIILIKSWCYYESHILGAYYGLISTYALETLVLYIFRIYHASLTSPLQVLYRFLEYYSKFDWAKFCISIDGPVNISSLPGIVVENPINHPFLSGEHLRDYINMFTVPCKEFVGNMPTFTPKVINIIDPLKASNNLGRSVHLGNFFRITFALGLAARKLGTILELSRENIQEGINKFFENTLNMNQSKPLLEPRLTFQNLPLNHVVEEHYEDDSESENPNADRDTRIHDNRGLEGNGLSANEEGGGNMNTNGSTGDGGDMNTNGSTGDGGDMNTNGSPGGGNMNTNGSPGGLDESDNLNLADLSGDYHGNVRNLLYSQCCQGFPYSSVQVHDPAGHPLAAWFEQNSTHVQAYPNGSVMQPAPNFTVHRTSSFIPHTGPSTRAIGKGRVTPLHNRQLNRTHGGSYETGSSSGNSNGPDPQSPQGHGQFRVPSPVHTQRRLEFGSFGPVSQTNSEPEVTYYLLARRTERVPNKPLPLMDENEFPPLSV
ncbi:hypothetical protein L1987_22151 [Smallanthus sonchifolius]|uniref:Uncharacterized protein n=1 Tax=Smallanthus sonchifolius TaxID=185202 RepID=A0ACB9IEM1_9ASTR|nr:hypothetical protein L1987_22151 [Smallanthus sonchifolius]